ncbi:MAG: hypothetical protein ACOCRO_00125 [Halanaerobiales bacterium]
MLKLRIISAIGLMISFFMPWFDYVGFSISGYEYAKYNYQAMIEMSPTRYMVFLLFLIPFFCVVIIAVELTKHSTQMFAGLVGLYSVITIISLAWQGFENINNMLEIIDIGYYFSVIFCIGLIISGRAIDQNKSNNRYKLTETQRAYRDQMNNLKK